MLVPATGPAWPIFLIGFMGTGKSTVGRALSADLALPFVDLDHVVEQDAGKSIKEIFDSDGESQFRSLETAALARLASSGPAVIATGGGAPAHADNLELMRRKGLVIALEASLDELDRRIGEGVGRPLWSAGNKETENLFAQRAPIYRRAHSCIMTDGRAISKVGEMAARVVESATRLAHGDLPSSRFVTLEARDYPVVVRRAGLDAAFSLAASQLGDATRVMLITDEVVAGHYLERAKDALRSAGIELAGVAVVASGESSKSMHEFSQLCDRAIAAGLDRSSAIIALGGGVVGDLAGFVASSIFRGIRVVQIPTSLLAMIDASIGGKTGINLQAGKNLVGSFWQPELVYIDPDLLATLSVRERRAAYGEMVKYGLLDGEELMQEIELLGAEVGAPELPDDESFRQRLSRAIQRCASYKAWVVGRDEREKTGERALLNLGHTVAHAIEADVGYGTIVHGEAVALGLLAACRLSARLGLASEELEDRIRQVLARAGLDVHLEPHLRDSVLERIKVDKKRTAGGVRFVTVSTPGACATTHLSHTELVRTLRP